MRTSSPSSSTPRRAGRAALLAAGATALAGLAPSLSIAPAARAADLPRRGYAPQSYAPLPSFTWTGLYAGLNAGYAFSTDKRTSVVIVPPNTFGPGVPGAAGSALIYAGRDRGGFTGGGQVGYNYQFTPGSGVVIGAEADLQYAGLTTNRAPGITAVPAFVAPAAVGFFDPRGARGVDVFGTVRGRLGYAFDRTLVYGTGGFAYGSGNRGFCFAAYGCGDSFRTGWVAGGGVEYALPADSFLAFGSGNAVTVKVEALYTNLDRGRDAGVYAANAATNAAYFAPATRGNADEFAVIRAGLNYKFGW